MESISQNGVNNSLPSNSGGNQNPPDPASMDSMVQTGHEGVVDWQEEVYQKIKSMKELYLAELNELYQKITVKCEQLEALVQQPKQSDTIEKLALFKSILERMMSFLQLPKSGISPAYMEKLSRYEEYFIRVVNAKRSMKSASSSQQSGQQELQHSVDQSDSIRQQPQSQIPQHQFMRGASRARADPAQARLRGGLGRVYKRSARGRLRVGLRQVYKRYLKFM